MKNKKECFGIMNETIDTKFALVKISKGKKIVYATDVQHDGIDKGTVGFEKGKQAHFFDDRYEAEKLCCLLACKNTFAFVMEVPSYFNYEDFKN